MRLGIIVQYYSFRSDLRRLIELLSARYDVVLFTTPDEAAATQEGVEVRVMRARKRTWRNRAWTVAYRVAGNLPADVTNHYDWKRRNLASGRTREGFASRLMLELGVRCPEIIDFDAFLGGLDYVEDTVIDDIDVFLSFTDVNDVYFMAQLTSAGKPIVTYLYSWDHPAKYTRFSRGHVHYLVWNEALQEDLTLLHGIPTTHVEAVGSSQLTYVWDYLASHVNDTPIYDFEYVYFGAAAGYPSAAAQEVQVIGIVGEMLQKVAPKVKLVLRPYPLASNWALYDPLKRLPNLVFDDYRAGDNGPVFSPDTIREKLNKIQHARTFLHLGSTLGLEASYFDTPILHLALEDVILDLGVRESATAVRPNDIYHIRKYLLLDGYANVIRNQEALERTLYRAVNEPESLLGYNRHLASFTPLLSMEAFVSKLTATLESRLAPEHRGQRDSLLENRRQDGVLQS